MVMAVVVVVVDLLAGYPHMKRKSRVLCVLHARWIMQPLYWYVYLLFRSLTTSARQSIAIFVYTSVSRPQGHARSRLLLCFIYNGCELPLVKESNTGRVKPFFPMRVQNMSSPPPPPPLSLSLSLSLYISLPLTLS